MRRIKRVKKITNNNYIDYIDMIYYINLENRKDRRNHIEKEIKKIDPEFKKTTRIEAIEYDPGAIGCGLSHIKALEDAIHKGYENIIILEDDFTFIKNFNVIFEESIIHLFKNYPIYNICLLSANVNKINPLDKYISEVLNAQTTSGYLINKKFLHTLKLCFKDAVEIMKKKYKYGQAEIDTHWKKLQGPGKRFYIFNFKPGYQAGSYSDIEKKYVSYNC